MSGTESSISDRERRMDEAIADYLKLKAAGQTPERASWLARFPDLAQELAEFLDDTSRLGAVLVKQSLHPGKEPSIESEIVDAVLPPSASGLVSGDVLEKLIACFPPDSQANHQQLATELVRELAFTERRPKKIGRFVIESILGRGGFGVVYLATDQQLQRKVAIKVPHAALVERPEDAELYLKEARTVAGLEHPSIVPVHEVGSTPEFPIFVVSKFIPGRDLAAQLRLSTPTTKQAVKWIMDLADALRTAHKQGIVHRDVKPQNVLVDSAENVYLVDFGLALRDEEVGRRLPAGGTPAYMSPEQAKGEGHRVDGRSDIFSLGVLFYELLSGRRPFSGNSHLELFEQITDFDPKPIRQWNDSVDREIERICLKMLSKRKSERYSSVRDLMDDLEVFLPTIQTVDSTLTRTPSMRPDAVSVVETVSANNSLETPIGVTATSGSKTLRIVPKGLRSFDQHDADFFLELLPGPRDRNGLPDTVGFWKTRIEERDSDNTFNVGLVYGPSGCGKSSMMKAGLLPRVSADIVTFYLEATPDQTESALLRMIRKRLSAEQIRFDESLDLVGLLTAIRRGRILPANKKILIVIDQFEQWLYAHTESTGTSLLDALLQCDGARLQAIVMVRDDFWMAATRFFRDLDIPLLERHNSAAVDLFDLVHAERVLKAFGRAFGKLQPNDSEDKADLKQFVTESIRGLARENKVISVRLALFAEMMKSRPWTLEALSDVGGTSGVGATFLEETFSAQGAPPQHRYHQTAARAVLRSLLPDGGTDIKGHSSPLNQLLAASGYESRPGDFSDLMRILDSELRLITPVDQSGAGDAIIKNIDSLSPGKPGERAGVRGLNRQATQPLTPNPSPRVQGEGSEELTLHTSNFELQTSVSPHYQLTHDYLIPSLRNWLTRKQRETRKGRAELKLDERAAAWKSKRENKQLPTIAEWLSIRWFTDSKQWSDPQRAMMRTAGRIHGMSWGGGLLALILIGAFIQSWVSAERWKNLQEKTRVEVEARVSVRTELFASHISSAKASRLSRRQGQRFDSLTAIHKAVNLLPSLSLSEEEQKQRRGELRDLAITCLTLPDIREIGDPPAKGMTLDFYRLNRSALRDDTGTLRIREWPEGVELARLPNVDQETLIEFAPEPDVILLINQKSHTLQRWQFQESAPTLVANLTEHDGQGRYVMFSSDSRRLLLTHRVGTRGVVEVLDWPSGKACFSREVPLQGYMKPARLSPNGQQLAVIEGAYGREGSQFVTVTSMDSGHELARLEHTASAQSVAWHPDSETLAVGLTNSNDIVLWNVEQQKQVGLLKNQRGGGPLLAMNTTGELLISQASWSNMLSIWHPYSMKVVLQMPSPLLFEWETQRGGLVGEQRASGGWQHAVAEPSPVVRTLARNPVHGDVESWRGVSVHPSGRLLAVGSDNGVTLFDLATGQDVGYLPVDHALHPWFIPGTGDLLTYSSKGLLRWPVNFSEPDSSHAKIGPPERLPCPAAFGTEVASDQSGKVIAAAAGNKVFILHDFGQRIVTLDALADCRHVAVSPDGRWVVTTSHGGGPTVAWDTNSGLPVHRFSEDQAAGLVRFSPDGEQLSFERHSPHRWQTTPWSELASPSTAQNIGYVCYSADGELAIELSLAGATLYEARTGRRLATLQLPEGPTVWHATFTPDGNRVILNSNDQHVTYVWNLSDLNRELSALGLSVEFPLDLPEVSNPKFTPALKLQIDLGELGP